MSFTAIVWVSLFLTLTVLSFHRAIWGVSLYFLSFFALPNFWWWGQSLPDYRWNLLSGVILLAAVILEHSRNRASGTHVGAGVSKLCIALLLNATAVHLLLADNWAISAQPYFLLAKFVLLFFLILASVRGQDDFRIVLLTLVVGAGYIGYEVTINDRGHFKGGRLEGVGAPGARGSNELACLCVTILPVIGGFLFAGRKWEKVVVVLMAPLVLNVILLCDSRAAFLGIIGAAIILLLGARGPTRKKAVIGVAFGALATFLLMGDPRIVQRFMSIFVPTEDRDASAADRMEYWQAGLSMIRDYPIGAGGDGFRRVHGTRYLAARGFQFDRRSVHNGYINETCEWGLQGVALRLAFILSAIGCARRAANYRRFLADHSSAILGSCLIAGMAGFLITSFFGDFLDSEWGYWIAALMVCYARLYGPAESQANTASVAVRTAVGVPQFAGASSV